MTRSNEDTSWRDPIGQDRYGIGDFTFYLYCHPALSSR